MQDRTLDKNEGASASNKIKLKIIASKYDTEIQDRIVSLGTEYQKHIGDNLYQYALTYDLHNEKIHLKELLASPITQECMKFFESSVGIHYISDSDNAIPKNKVLIKIKYDQEGLPEYFEVLYKPPVSSIDAHCKIDAVDGEKNAKVIRESRLTCLSDPSGLDNEITSIANELGSKNSQQRFLLMANFNKKWEGQLTMTYEISNPRLGICVVQDKNGIFSCRISGKLLVNELPLSVNTSISTNPSSIWNQNAATTSTSVADSDREAKHNTMNISP